MKRFCKTCGAEIGDGTNICSICGSVYGQPQANDTTVLNSNTNFANQSGNETTVLNRDPKFSVPQKKVPPDYDPNHSYQAQNPFETVSTSNPHLQNPYMQQKSNINHLNGQPLNNQNGAASNSSPYYDPPVASQNGFGQGNNYNVPNNYTAAPHQQGAGFVPVTARQKNKLSTGAIIGIVIGAVVIIGILITMIAVIAVYNSSVIDITGSDASDTYVSDFELGTINENNIYINNFADLKLKLPGEDWRFLTKEEIYQDYQDLGIDAYYDEIDQSVYMIDSTGTTYADAYLTNMADGSNVQVMLVDSSSSFDTLGDYFSAIESQINASYSNAYMKDVGIFTFGNNMYSVKEGGGITNGVSIVQYYAGANIDGDFVIITATFEKSSAPSFMEFFEALSAY